MEGDYEGDPWVKDMGCVSMTAKVTQVAPRTFLQEQDAMKRTTMGNGEQCCTQVNNVFNFIF